MQSFLHSPLLSSFGAVHGFSTRQGGVSPEPWTSLNLGGSTGDEPGRVEANLQRLLSGLAVERRTLATASQVHGTQVVHARMDRGSHLTIASAPGGEPLLQPEADALIAAPGAAVGVRTADCVPILLFDPGRRLAAAIHAGWRGTLAGIVAGAVQSLARQWDVPPQRLVAAVGPAIGLCCYEVGAELADRFEAGLDPSAVRRADGRPPRLDLPGANRLLLERAGLAPERVEVLGRCTSCEPALFFSHRRDRGRTGRHLSVIRAG